MTTPDDSALEQAVAQLQSLRATLGDAAVDQAVAALRANASGPKPEATGARPPHRLRQVSILFADVANSTALLGRLDTEDAMDVLGRALVMFAAAVERWGGVVLRSAGDGIMAAFGLHGLREDESERAVRAGLQILTDSGLHAERVQRDLGVTGFGVRVGIHTGPVLIGPGPDGEHDVMGHAVHLAARMEQSAPIGQLRISDATWSDVRGLFDAEPQAPIMVKGHDEPLRTWIVRDVVAGTDGQVSRGVEGVVTPTIGRDAELDRLVALHARCVAQRCVGLATVVADAGIGKTRLRREFLRRLGLADDDAGVLQVRAQPASELQPYGLLYALLARWFSIRVDVPVAEARQRLIEGLAPWLGRDAERQAARLGQVVGLDFRDHPGVQPMSPSALRDAAFEALRTALLARAARTPLLLVVDDVHWADDGTLAFLRSLLRPANVPLMVLLLARPSLNERGFAFDPTPGVETEALTLAPLGSGPGHALVRALLEPLPDAPDDLQQMLLDRSAGNPFFLEALVRMLIDDGVIDAHARPWRLHADRLAALRVPPTLVGVLQARLDALPEEELRSLQGASIIGPVFWDAALAAIDVAAPPALPALGRRSLVASRDRSAFADTVEYAFAHALLYDVTYDTVLKSQRREGHAAVARWLSEQLADRASEFLAVTAQHYERGGESVQALEFWDRAALDAGLRYANEAALLLNERALSQPALTDRRWRYRLLTRRHDLQSRLGRAADAAASLVAMEAWAAECDDNAMRVDMLATRMLEADHAGRPEEAQLLAKEAIALRELSDDSGASGAALAHGELAWLATLRLDYATVETEVEAGMEQARIAARVPRRHLGYDGYANQLRAIAIDALLSQERYADALVAVEAGLRETASDIRDRYNLLVRKSRAERELGRLDDALGAAEEAFAIGKAAGVVRMRLGAVQPVAKAALWAGDFGRTAALLADAEKELGAPGLSGESLSVATLAAELARLRGDREAARRGWGKSLALAREVDAPSVARDADSQLAHLDVEDGALAQARAGVDRILAEIASDPRPQHRALSAEALLACHDVLSALGDPRASTLRGDLIVRLDEQLDSLPDDAARELLLRNVRHWRAVEGLRR